MRGSNIVVAGDHGLDLGQRDPHRVDQGECARRRAHALRASGQELVAEQRAQAGEVVAHGRLAEADPGGGTRDIALGEQRVESNEQVQVECGSRLTWSMFIIDPICLINDA